MSGDSIGRGEGRKIKDPLLARGMVEQVEKIKEPLLARGMVEQVDDFVGRIKAKRVEILESSSLAGFLRISGPICARAFNS